MNDRNETAGRNADGPCSIRIATSMSDFSREEWSRLDGTSHDTLKNNYNPFISYEFLRALEQSGCASASTGWQAHHLRLESANGGFLGAAPCYVKSHSRGEYVFDHGWAEAFERAGGHYYPKLQCSVPFTPVTGPRLLTPGQFQQKCEHFCSEKLRQNNKIEHFRDSGKSGNALDRGHDGQTCRAALAAGLTMLTERLGLSSAHVTFAQEADMAALKDASYLWRDDWQFHFRNEGYDSYEDFLGTLASRKRKALRAERRKALADDISVDWLTGSDITESAWDSFFAFYMDTAGRKWGRPHLNRRFFSIIAETMADDIVLIMARRGGRYIAGAINFVGSDRLYGRNWGCIEDHPFLHFEICYHQAIDFAIAHKLEIVEAGTQGEHKLARGYLPAAVRSAHYITHPGLRRAVGEYLDQERHEMALIGVSLRDQGPFRKEG